jgi:endonuclease/exonuclease/phosphatase family metal-dependent hydrolase
LQNVPQVKIITINTWKCDGEYHLRMALMAARLKLLKADIIACQECFLSDEGGADTLKFLAGELNMNYLFANGRGKKRFFDGNWVESQSGLGILSVYPIVGIDVFSLPAISEDNDRKAQQVEVSLPGGKKVLVTNVHLTHLSHAAGLRKIQAEFVAAKAAALTNYRYKIVCGDFNAEQGTLEIEAFKTRCNALDCYTAGNGPEPRYSLEETLKAGRHVCVDHIFVLPMPDGNLYPKLIDSGIVLSEPDDETGLYASDHFGICTTLLIE